MNFSAYADESNTETGKKTPAPPTKTMQAKESVHSTAMTSSKASDPAYLMENLIYYPHRGVFNVTLRYYRPLTDNGQSFDYTGTSTSTSSTQYDEIVPTLTYGITHSIRASLAVTNVVDSTTSSTNSKSGIGTQNSTNGFSNPTLGLTWRYSNGMDSWPIAEAVLSYVPGLTSKNSAVTGNTTTPAQIGNEGGPTAISFALPFFWHIENSEYELAPTLNSYSSYTSQGTTLGSTDNYNSYLTEALAAYYRYHFDSKWYAQLQLSYELNYTYQTQTQAANAPIIQRALIEQVSPTLRVGWVPLTWIELDLFLANSGSTTNSTPSTGTSTSSNSSQLQASFQARAEF